MKIFSLIVFCFLALVVYKQAVFACSCIGSDMPDCVRFKETDAAFIGKISKIEINPVKTEGIEEDTIYIQTKWVYFEVEHPLKGVSSLKTRVLTSHGTSCDFEGLKAGQRWLVFANQDDDGDLSFGKCGGSYQISNKNAIPGILSELTAEKKKPTISGTIGTYIYSTPGIDIFVEGQGEKFSTKTDNSGFTAVVSSPGRYKVKAVVPYSAVFTSPYEKINLAVTTGENESSVEYEVDLYEGDCVFNMITMAKIDLKATGSISGRALNFIDDDGLENYVYLLRLGATETETLGKYQTLERIKNGEFKFPGLREGTYVLALNPNNFPERKIPFLRTYLPGTSDFSTIQVINLEQGQTISDIVFDLPKHLPQQIVTGQFVLPNGKPVTQDLRRGEDSLIFRLFNPNKVWNSNYLDSVESEFCDNSAKGLACEDFITIDKSGNFSFKAFTGFTYLVEVEIVNSKGKTKHGYAYFTPEVNMKPLRIVIDRDGEADANEFVKQQNKKQPTVKK